MSSQDDGEDVAVDQYEEHSDEMSERMEDGHTDDEAQEEDEEIDSAPEGQQAAGADPFGFNRKDNAEADEEDEEEEFDPRFELELPEELEDVDAFDMLLPGHGSHPVTVEVHLSEPNRPFEAAYQAQLESLRRDTILRRLQHDPAAVKEFLRHERGRASAVHGRHKKKKSPEEADNDDDDDDVNSDNADEDGVDGDDEPGQQQGEYYTLDGEEDSGMDSSAANTIKTKAIKDLEERLLRRRAYPYWLRHLLANDAPHFERVCKAMYGYAVPPPPLPALTKPLKGDRPGDKLVPRNSDSTAVGGDAEEDVGRKHTGRRAVSFYVGSGSSLEDNKGEFQEDAYQEEDEEEEHLSTADPARKSSSFFLKSNAFADDRDTVDGHSEGNDTVQPRQSSDAVAATSTDGPATPSATTLGAADASGNVEQADEDANASREAAARQALFDKPRTVSIVPAGSVSTKRPSHAAAPPLTAVPAFTDANFPLYIVWEATSETWQLLDCHPDVFLFRAKQAEKRRKRAAAARKARAEQRRQRQLAQQQSGRGGEDVEEEEEDEDGSDDASDVLDDQDEDEEEGAASAGDEDEESDNAGEDGGNGEDEEEVDVDPATRKERRAWKAFLRNLPRFEIETMITTDALMVAALRSPAALRLMLLQPPAQTADTAAAPASEQRAKDAADDDGEGVQGSEAAQPVEKSFTELVASAEKVVSLRNIQDWMEADFATGFPILSAVYTTMLSIRAVDAVRLPYPVLSSLPLDFNFFFAPVYVLSQSTAPRLLGSQQCKDLDPTTKRLEGVASPRSEAAVETMQSLLRAGIVPSRPIDQTHLNTPESLQLMLWLMLMVPSGLLRAWAMQSKAVLQQMAEHGEMPSVANALQAALQGNGDEEDDDDAEDDDDDAWNADNDDVDDMTEVMVLQRVLQQAKVVARTEVRDLRRRVKDLKRKLGLPMPVARDSVSTSEEDPTVSNGTTGVGTRASGAAGQPEATWKSVTTDVASLEKRLAALVIPPEQATLATAFLPGPLLIQTVLELRRRVALEKSGHPPTCCTLAFVLEKPLAHFMRTVENGKRTGDPLVTSNFHVDLAIRDANAHAAAQDDGVGASMGLEATFSFASSTASEHATPANPTASEKKEPVKTTPHQKELPSTPPLSLPAPSRLLQKQNIYQSDLVLLLLALTSTQDKPSQSSTTKMGFTARTSALHGDAKNATRSRGPAVNSTSVVMTRRPLASAAGGSTRGGAGARNPTGALDGAANLEASAKLSEYPTDAHAELFEMLLETKLAAQAAKTRVGRPTVSLLDKVRAGTLRLLFLALPRFAQRSTMQMLCDVAPLHELLGPNERVPLMDLVTSWSIERDWATGGSAALMSHLGGSAHGLDGSSSRMNRSSANATPLVTSLSKVTYLDIFVRTFWSEMAYRLEGGLYPAQTAETIRALLPGLLEKVYECVAAYSKVVHTLVSGRLLKHSVIHRAVMSAFALLERKPDTVEDTIKHLRTHDTSYVPTATAAAPKAAANTENIGKTAAGAGASQMLSPMEATLGGSSPLPAPGELVSEMSGAHQSSTAKRRYLLHLLSPYGAEYLAAEDRIQSLFHALPMAPRTIFTPELLFSLLFTSQELDAVAVRFVMTVQGVTEVRQAGPFALSSGGSVTREREGVPGGLAIFRSSVTSRTRLHSPTKAGSGPSAAQVSLTATTTSTEQQRQQRLKSFSGVDTVGLNETSTCSAATAAAAAAAVGRPLPALEYALRTKNLRVARLLVMLGTPLDDMCFGGACTLETLAERCLSKSEVDSLRGLAQRRQEALKTDPDAKFGAIRVL